MERSSKHVSSLLRGDSEYSSEFGSITRVNADTLPILKNLSIKRLVLAPGAIREPHWHANAVELSYCLSGKVLISILDNGSNFSSFTISAGQMFHVDSGALHGIENIAGEDAELIIAFRHERPEDFSMRAAFGAMTDAVLGNTYGLPASAFATIPRTTQPVHIVHRQGEAIVLAGAGFGNPHKFDIEAQSPPIDSAVGSAHLARVQFWPVLKNISMYSLRIHDNGMREPHWHPETAEMGYVHQGHARMTILDPDGSTDTYELEPGDVYYVPRAYPHQIEVLDEQIHFLIFFDQPTPGDIGYRASVSAFSRETLAAALGIDGKGLPDFPLTTIDPLVVTRVNPLDPVGH